MMIRSLVNAGMASGSLAIGHEYDVADEQGRDLIRAGFAIEIDETTSVDPPKPPTPVKKPRKEKAAHVESD